MAQVDFFPSPSLEALRSAFVGKSLHDVPSPSAILDVSKLKRNCQLMLDAVAELKLGFRAHVKTHKTTELTRLQVGENSKDVRLIVSTLIELESLVPLLKDYQSNGAKVNVLYGIPLGPSKVSRLAAVAKDLGPGTITAMIDDLEQLHSVHEFKRQSNTPICVFIKADSGYHRAGLPPNSNPMIELVNAVAQSESTNDLIFLGFYSHNSLSYNGRSPDDAMAMLKQEIDACRQAAAHLSSNAQRQDKPPLVISVGDSPAALSIYNILPSSPSSSSSSSSSSSTDISTHLLSALSLTQSDFVLEIHAGVYPVLDLQQTAANPRNFSSSLSAHQSQALTILAEVVSLYPTRTAVPEALISAGTLALGREPCQGYSGWGVVTAWNLGDRGNYGDEQSVDPKSRVVVKRISQEHGVLGWEDGEKTDVLPVRAGDRVMVWVNHACVAAAGYGWYLIVDGEKGGDVVEDVWVRWRGW